MTDRDVAELIAKFRTPPGLHWEGLADDIETVLQTKTRTIERLNAELTKARANGQPGKGA